MGNIGARLKRLEQAATSKTEKPVYLVIVEDGHEPTEEEKRAAIARAVEEARQTPKGLHYPLVVDCRQ
jgi:hypothetical protein